ncbi:MAG: Gfo/Idh/MocA family oxidoreductase [Pseudomonadota bacterium]|nr:oxidoreductase [Gammaproteobacteria bacterium]MEC8950105.1 Gfo/Idh/MocA family oxidoreductase [Pseudomonadota bacterium]MEC9300613.1 Gfo/Idh/MocA family oxidoreductase [Pseudomonadota bacterium]MEE3143935.1 Gfo/Idh/MocA family oxidoreductase [Pseudomonadota bacterium]MEE3237837.1 Gfo/Idh/MocA family oxidoreductase [Pseudomonadota bacterium]|tara:strand:+ start:903 stop:2042 length:1140 start_codon:yes stop_codon:yes gene_type:complete
MSSKKIRLGLVGGGIGAFIGEVHRIAARLDDRYELVAGAFSSEPRRAADSAAELRIDPARSYNSFEEMAKKESKLRQGIEVVSIVTPNHLHCPAAKAFLKAGIHVICDKPLSTTLEDAEEVESLVKESGLIFAITYNYSGYPMVRHAREMVASGKLGNIRVIQVEYAQDWLATNIEAKGQKQAAWRTDPELAGAGGSIGDIGTHAFHLAEFISGLEAKSLLADLDTFVSGRKLDDNANILLHYSNGAKGMLWSSQVASGQENALRIRLFGDKGGLEWAQEDPNYLHYTQLGESHQVLTRGGHGLAEAAVSATRTPAGHPEGFLEGFANLYRDIADMIEANRTGKSVTTLVPDVTDGVKGIRFVEKAVNSSAAGSIWQHL